MVKQKEGVMNPFVATDIEDIRSYKSGIGRQKLICSEPEVPVKASV